jgi:cellulose synthase operon protein C
MRRLWLLAMAAPVGVAALAQPACARQEPTRQDPAALAQQGRYQDAIAALRGASAASSRRLLVQLLLEVGRYDDAIAAALGRAAPDAVAPELANMLGEALYARGRRAEAEAAYARALEAGGASTLRPRLNLAIAKWERGARDEALREFDWFIDAYNDGRARTADELTAVGTAVRYLGIRDPQLFHDAVKAYEEAGRLDASHVESRLREGDLFLEKYSSSEAAPLYREVLERNPRHPRALLGLARAKAFDGTDEALVLADSSLAVNPHSPEARAFRAQLLLGLEDFEGAEAEAKRALDVNPASLDALAVLGAVLYLRGDRSGYDDARRRALALNPAFGGFDRTVAEMAVQQRRYREAVELARAALQVDSLNWSAHALLGLTELRLGDVAAARAALEKAFAGDPYNPWVKNTLDLIDTYKNYVTRKTDRFELFLDRREADVLALYMSELAEEAYDKLAQHYGVRPQTPVRVEVYPSHADFSVRTVGLTGLAALGVSFGNILALGSPSAGDAGRFNWGSTLWHEIAHAVTLAASEHRVPRWLTEGLSVLEERRAREGWGDDVTVSFIAALQRGALLPVSELNAGFVRPKYPEQIMHAYYEASLVAELIEHDFGERALRDMLAAYRAGRTTDEVMRSVLRTEPAAFDEKFLQYMKQRFAQQLAAVTARGNDPATAQVAGPFAAAMRAAKEAFDASDMTTAQREAERARQLFPEYAAADGPYRLLHAIHVKQGDARAAVQALRGQIAINEHDYDAHVELAKLLEQQADRKGAADVLERAMYIYPFDPAVHGKLAELYAATAQHVKAVRERRAVLALDPVNRADALYRLAVALNDAGQKDEARRQVVRALELAPNFAEAQQLLLRLRGGSQ